MKKLNKILITSISSLSASAALVAPLCLLTNKTNVKADAKTEVKSSSNSKSYAYVTFTTDDANVSFTGATKVRARAGMPLGFVTKPKATHAKSWKFAGWYDADGNKADDTIAIPSTGVTLTPKFEEPIDITNCLGISAIEKTKVTFVTEGDSIPDLYYSTDYGKNWNKVTSTSTEYEMARGTTIYLKGLNDGLDGHRNGFSQSTTNYTHITFNDNVNIFGNCLALIYNGEAVDKATSAIPNDHCFYHLFAGNGDYIKNVSDNFLFVEGDTTHTNLLKDNCFEGMFMGCTSLTKAPRLFATNENVKNAQGCYKDIFNGCSAVNSVRTKFTEDFAGDDYKACFEDWLTGVANNGTIIYDGTAPTTRGGSTIPANWTISQIPDAVEITTSEETVKYFQIDHEYKLNATCKKGASAVTENEVIWYIYDETGEKYKDKDKVTVNQATGTVKCSYAGTEPIKVNIRAVAKANLNVHDDIEITFNPIEAKDCTQIYAVEDSEFHWTYVGEVGAGKTLPTFRYSADLGKTWNNMLKDTDVSIKQGDTIWIKGDNTSGLSLQENEESHTKFVTTSGKVNIDGDIKGLIFDGRWSDDVEVGTNPAIPCNYCFKSLFQGANIGTVNSGFLSYKDLNGKTNVYASMFEECNNMTQAPNLPATVLTDSCYFRMFFNCYALKAVPTLSGTSLADACYKRMFYGCKAITSTPALPVKTAKPYCYYMMFQNCSSINSIGLISLENLEKYSCFQMFASGVTQELFGKIGFWSGTPRSGTLFFKCPSSIPTGAVERMISYSDDSGSKSPESGYLYGYIDGHNI